MALELAYPGSGGLIWCFTSWRQQVGSLKIIHAGSIYTMEIGSICPSEICFSLPESCTAQLSETPGWKQGLKGKGVLLMRRCFQAVESGFQCKRVSNRKLRVERPNSHCGCLDMKESSLIPGGFTLSCSLATKQNITCREIYKATITEFISL